MNFSRTLRRALLSSLKIADKIVIACLRRLPRFLQASIRENIEPHGRLDFDGANIALTLNSKLELKRLFPCREEPATCEWIKTRVKPGDVFYDIGANAGSYSFIAYAAAKRNCRIVAFEPNPFTFASLSKNILLNNCGEDIAALLIALSDTTALTSFRYSTLRAGAASHALGDNSNIFSDPGLAQRVLAMRLDDAIERFALPPPTHMKIDVDGAELKVLTGAERTLAGPAVRSVLIEINERKNSAREIAVFLEERGFAAIEKRPVHRASSGIFNCVFERP